MIDRLTRPCVYIKHGAIPGLMDAKLYGEFFGRLKHIPNQYALFRRNIVQGWDVLAWNHQHMHGGLRIEILKRHHMFVFIDQGGRDFFAEDFAKETCGVHVFLLTHRAVTGHVLIPKHHANAIATHDLSRDIHCF
jgi:hypothetical protein